MTIKKYVKMNKKEERYLECFQDGRVRNCSSKEAFLLGYHQAEKDLELTWVDIKIILDIEIDILRECNSQKELVLKTYPKGEDYYGEILKRFKKLKPDGS